jgi:hypothetical protein
MLGVGVVLKVWPLPSVFDKAKVLFRASRAHRHWRGAGWLSRRGLSTAETLLLAAEPEGARLWLVMAALPGMSVLEHLAAANLTVRQEHAVARALGEMIAFLQEGCRYNRDGKPSNLLVQFGADERISVAIIDCQAIRREPWLRADEPFGSFARLLIEPLGTGVAVRRALMLRVIDSYLRTPTRVGALTDPRERKLQARLIWQKAAEYVRNHGDPTPRVNPLVAPSAPHSSDMH